MKDRRKRSTDLQRILAQQKRLTEEIEMIARQLHEYLDIINALRDSLYKPPVN